MTNNRYSSGNVRKQRSLSKSPLLERQSTSYSPVSGLSPTMQPSHSYHLPGGYENFDKFGHRNPTLPNKMLNERPYTLKSYRETSPRDIVKGPLKADHNLRVSMKKKENPYKVNQLSPLVRKKSSSLSNLSTRHLDDVYHTNTIDWRGPKKQIYCDDSEPLSKKSEQLLINAKIKLSKLGHISTWKRNTLHKKYGSSNDLEFVSDGVKKINILNSKQKSMDNGGLKTRSSRNIGAGSSGYGLLRKSSSELNVCVKGTQFKSSEDKVTSKRRHSISGESSKREYGHGLVGLRNLGNTCYMNCVLQCLCKTKLLRAYFYNNKRIKGKLANAFMDLMQEVWSKGALDSITPSLLKSQVQKYAPRFAGANQQDSQEFLRFFLEGIHDDLNSVKKKPVFPFTEDDHLSDAEMSNIYWDRYLARENSVVQDLFVGQLKSTLTCSVCGHRSVTYDPFWDLSLPIPSKSCTDDVEIARCFEGLTQEETLDGDEMPTCEKCKRRRRCSKGFLIERFPKILVLHLKRFSGHRYRTKLETKVVFPFILELKEFSANSFGKPMRPVYNLYGVANHIGGTHGGHYTAYSKHPDTNQWHIYNDSRVGETMKSRVISQSAYVLFYELQTT